MADIIAGTLGLRVFTQWGWKYRRACGAAAMAAVLDFFHLLGTLTVGQLADETALADGDKGLSCAQVAELGLSNLLDCAVVENLTIDRIKAEIAAGHPVIPLIAYRDIPEREDQADKVPGVDGHFVAIDGFSADGTLVYICDPDILYNRGKWGQDVPVKVAELDKALADALPARQGVVCYGVLQTEPAFSAVTNADANLRVLAGGSYILTMPKGSPVWVLKDTEQKVGSHTWLRVQFDRRVGWVAKELLTADQHPPAPTPAPEPIPHSVPVGVAHTNTPGDVLNLHEVGDLNSQRLGQIPDRQNVVILDVEPTKAEDTVWVKVTWGIESGWVAEEYLAAGAAPVIVSPAPTPAPAPAPTVTYKWVKSALNLRKGAGRAFDVLQEMPPGEKVILKNTSLVGADGAKWQYVIARDGTVGWCADSFLSDTPPVAAKVGNKAGLHFIEGSESRAALIALCQELHDKGTPLAGVTIVNDAGLANTLAPLVDVVVLRTGVTDHDETPVIPQDKEKATAAGAVWAAQRMPVGADRRVYLQFYNERGFDTFDAEFNIGIMQYVEAAGHKAAIFADAVGNPGGADWLDKWQLRIPAMQHAMAHGHIVAYHGYGTSQFPDAGASDPRSQEFFSLRYRKVWVEMPSDARPGLAITETGTYRAGAMGTEFTLADMKAYATLVGQDQYVKAFMYWTLCRADDKKWGYSRQDGALGAIGQWLAG